MKKAKIGKSRFDINQKNDMVNMKQQGHTYKEIAKYFNCHPDTVFKTIKNNQYSPK